MFSLGVGWGRPPNWGCGQADEGGFLAPPRARSVRRSLAVFGGTTAEELCCWLDCGRRKARVGWVAKGVGRRLRGEWVGRISRPLERRARSDSWRNQKVRDRELYGSTEARRLQRRHPCMRVSIQSRPPKPGRFGAPRVCSCGHRSWGEHLP